MFLFTCRTRILQDFVISLYDIAANMIHHSKYSGVCLFVCLFVFCCCFCGFLFVFYTSWCSAVRTEVFYRKPDLYCTAYLVVPNPGIKVLIVRGFIQADSEHNIELKTGIVPVVGRGLVENPEHTIGRVQ